MVESDDEIERMARSRKGDPAAFEALIQKYQQMIHALTYRMTGSLADCKDLAQETFVRAYRQWDSFQGDAKFSSWLYRIAVNACLDWRRRESRRQQMLNDWAEGDACSSPSNGLAGNQDERIALVQAALMKLPEKQRAAIVLTVYGDHSHAEAAKSLGCTEATVSWRVFSARRKLKKLLSKPRDHHD